MYSYQSSFRQILNIEHNRAAHRALSIGIIGKKNSIIRMSLVPSELKRVVLVKYTIFTSHK